ncbi:MAG TPA: PadR family transcriptional regulator [Demequina sp.]|nr:PadR family transcriptional regulator [Demequina sp.]
MSIRHSLLVLLSESDRYGYELRTEFEGRTGGVWPLNVGQVYSTLDRLERDGLVTREDVDGERQVRYSLSDAGRAALSAWWASPVPVSKVGRDDVALKIALAASTAGVDVVDVIRAQRRSVMSALQDLNRAKRSGSDEAWELVADALIFRAEAEVRWLDHTAARLARRSRHPGSQPATEPSKQHTSKSEEVR